MPPNLRYSLAFSRSLNLLLNKTICDKHVLYCYQPSITLMASSGLQQQQRAWQHQQQSSQSNQLETTTANLHKNLVTGIQNRISWANQQYEKFFGISEIRIIQEKVLEAESEFVELSKARKVCHDRIDNLKNSIKNLRDKLDSTPRESENYIELIKIEHKLLNEQLALEAKLAQLKEREQFSFDILSKLLRRSHEQERLRQEKSKYWQIISVALSVMGSMVALIAQKSRSQGSIMKQLNSFEIELAEMKESVQNNMRETEKHSQYFGKVIARLDRLQDSLRDTKKRTITTSRADDESSRGPTKSTTGWTYYLPGLAPIKSLLRYMFSSSSSGSSN